MSLHLANSDDFANPQTACRLLLADAHELMRQSLASLLEHETGFSVVAQARGGSDALRLALEDRPNIAIVELSLPDMSATEIVKRMSVECPDVRVLVLTNRALASTVVPLLRAGVKGYVLKRSDPRELMRALRVVAEGGKYVDPDLSDAFDFRLGQRRRPASGLTKRETSVLMLLAWGYSNSQIGERLNISTKTVEFYRAHALKKLNVRGRSGIVRYAVREGWLTEENMPVALLDDSESASAQDQACISM